MSLLSSSALFALMLTNEGCVVFVWKANIFAIINRKSMVTSVCHFFSCVFIKHMWWLAHWWLFPKLTKHVSPSELCSRDGRELEFVGARVRRKWLYQWMSQAVRVLITCINENTSNAMTNANLEGTFHIQLKASFGPTNESVLIYCERINTLPP